MVLCRTDLGSLTNLDALLRQRSKLAAEMRDTWSLTPELDGSTLNRAVTSDVPPILAAGSSTRSAKLAGKTPQAPTSEGEIAFFFFLLRFGGASSLASSPKGGASAASVWASTASV